MTQQPVQFPRLVLVLFGLPSSLGQDDAGHSIGGDEALCCMELKWQNDLGIPYDTGSVCYKLCFDRIMYKTSQNCVLNLACEFLEEDYGLFMDEMRRRGMSAISDDCYRDLGRALCAYHFPECIADNINVSHEVCRSTCTDMEKSCYGISLSNITALDNCADRNYACTSPAPSRLVPTALSWLGAPILIAKLL